MTDNDIIKRQQAEIEELQGIVNEMGDVFPSCMDCEGKTVWGERTDKCVYETDRKHCIKKGIENSLRLMSENRQLKEEVERLKHFEKKVLEPVVENLKEIELAKTEAYEEFAERLNERILKQLPCSTMEKKEAYYFCLDEVENVLKERTEVSDE